MLTQFFTIIAYGGQYLSIDFRDIIDYLKNDKYNYQLWAAKKGYLMLLYPLLALGSISDACYSFSKKVY